ncbi:hypothetical protein ACL02U_12105 [Streptomyces sp. MS06]|uniref:hypothetical protein n=1 Tax=Streptomyces sp. MS06 TaxID=3385974 RepID=UPI0039A27399
MTVDVSQVQRLSRDLYRAGPQVQVRVRAVVERGAVNVKRDWRANAAASAGRHARLYPASISYDMRHFTGGAIAEIGPDKGRPQGALGNLLEYGSSKNPPHMDGARAITAEAPRFEEQIAAAVGRRVL